MTASKPHVAAAVRPVLDRIDQLGWLESNWDSYGGEPPTAEATAAAASLVTAVAGKLFHEVGDRVRPYAVAPLADGCIQLTWRGVSDEIEVEVGAQGTLGYLLVRGRGEDEAYQEGDDVSEARILDLVAGVVLPPGHG